MFPHRPYALGLVRRALLCLLLMSSGGVRAQEAQPANGRAANVLEIKDGEFAAAIERAMRGAQRRLRRPECARIFDDFSDGNGRPLSEILATLAMTPMESTARAIFRDGRENARCRTAVAAFTGPGSRVVFVCGNRFGAIGRERAELIIIHELLHTLGLKERPPASARSIGWSRSAADRSRGDTGVDDYGGVTGGRHPTIMPYASTVAGFTARAMRNRWPSGDTPYRPHHGSDPFHPGTLKRRDGGRGVRRCSALVERHSVDVAREAR